MDTECATLTIPATRNTLPGTYPAMSFKTNTLAALVAARAKNIATSALVGLDGFVDTIVTPVAQRTAQGEFFTPISSIPEFAQRIAGAAGKSTNIEFYPLMDKLGGNGPIMANALLAAGTRLTYIGALGRPSLHAVFLDFASRAEVVSLCDPATTIAVEFDDGKLMLGQLRSLDTITLESIEEVMGADRFRSVLAGVDLVSLVNWTMIPNMTDIFLALVNDVLPALPPREGRHFFFDLADPEKRSREDLLEVLQIIARFGEFGSVTLGLNLKEAQRVHAELGFPACGETEEELRTLAADIRRNLKLSTVVVHPRASAACATAEGTWWVPGPYAEKPLITTGAGDHFNAGFAQGQMLGMDPEACLTLGVCTSGHYVRTAESPTLDDLEKFLADWK
jgi:sugar/nucleoside kinase (ribokinase family)